MSHESAAIATQEMKDKGLSRFHRIVGTTAVLALAAGLPGCGAAHESGSATQTPEATVTPTSVDPYYPETSSLFNSTSYYDWGEVIDSYPVWVAPGIITEKADPNSGSAATLPLATVNGMPACSGSRIGESIQVSKDNIKLYTVNQESKTVSEVPDKYQHYQVFTDGTKIDITKLSTKAQCVQYQPGVDGYTKGDVPSQAIFSQQNGTSRVSYVAKSFEDGGLNAAKAANDKLNGLG